ncbi:hypothetical protein EJP82_12010 [Paenibacillus anaericanus]|uniref:Uncharacterized protein n=1 Tax=Paenibacillus anaericanus TaxID=170367 RepID=A0A433Y9R2_9BACL|nr:hypothetical protein EJP82_12010 [Paenibacillus anaericanus]
MKSNSKKSVTSPNTIITQQAIRPLVRIGVEDDSNGVDSDTRKRNQPDTFNSLTASRPPFGLKGVGRREYKTLSETDAS